MGRAGPGLAGVPLLAPLTAHPTACPPAGPMLAAWIPGTRCS